MTTKHTCPGLCGREVPEAFYACRSCWFSLPSQMRAFIVSTARLSLLDPKRRRALNVAGRWYRENRAPEVRP